MPPIPVNILTTAFGMPPVKAIAYLKAKLPELTIDWQALSARAHQTAFTVARMMDLDLLQSTFTALQEAQASGLPFAEFKAAIEPTLRSAGWWGRDAAGKLLGTPWRLETIYRTNMQSAFMAGRRAEQTENADKRPYWQYVAIGDDRTRDSHRAIDGIVLPADSEFWARNYPPNGFNCRCRVRALSERELKRDGLSVSSLRGVAGTFEADTGFDSAPGTTPLHIDRAKYNKKLLAAYDRAMKDAPSFIEAGEIIE